MGSGDNLELEKRKIKTWESFETVILGIWAWLQLYMMYMAIPVNGVSVFFALIHQSACALKKKTKVLAFQNLAATMNQPGFGRPT